MLLVNTARRVGKCLDQRRSGLAHTSSWFSFTPLHPKRLPSPRDAALRPTHAIAGGVILVRLRTARPRYCSGGGGRNLRASQTSATGDQGDLCGTQDCINFDWLAAPDWPRLKTLNVRRIQAEGKFDNSKNPYHDLPRRYLVRRLANRFWFTRAASGYWLGILATAAEAVVKSGPSVAEENVC